MKRSIKTLKEEIKLVASGQIEFGDWNKCTLLSFFFGIFGLSNFRTTEQEKSFSMKYSFASFKFSVEFSMQGFKTVKIEKKVLKSRWETKLLSLFFAMFEISSF